MSPATETTGPSMSVDPKNLLRDLEAYEAQIRRNGHPNDDVLRVKLREASSRVSRVLENGFDLTSRIMMKQPVEDALIRLGLDMGIYKAVGANNSPLTHEQLLKTCEAEPTLLTRLVRGQAAFGSLWDDESGGRYILPPSSNYLADPAFASAYKISLEWIQATFRALPEWLASQKYQQPQTDAKNLAIQAAHDCQGKGLFEILGERPQIIQAMVQLMSTWGQHDSLLHEDYPVMDRLAAGFDPSICDVLLVDVGGGWGQKSAAIKKALGSQLPGRLVSQDLPHVVASAPASDLVEVTAHDFFTPQPIKFPRAFYIRQTLHNWSDESCVKILSLLRDAMRPGYTKLLLHELVMPASRASTWAVAQDFSMMTQLGTLERTVDHFQRIVEDAGLKVTEVFLATNNVTESVIEIIREA